MRKSTYPNLTTEEQTSWTLQRMVNQPRHNEGLYCTIHNVYEKSKNFQNLEAHEKYNEISPV